MYDPEDKDRFNTTVLEFTYFMRRVIPQLKSMKKNIESYKNAKSLAIANYQPTLAIFESYETSNLSAYLSTNEQ